jgi:3-hydroxybutyryl-CoA dehydratase
MHIKINFGQMQQKRKFADVNPGEKTSFSKTISEADIMIFAGICGDFNPIHIDSEFAKTSFFHERVAHGMLTGSLISTAVAAILGSGGIYISQSLKFRAPVKIGETITATAEVIEKMQKNRLRMRTQCMDRNGKIVIDGEAVGFIPT